MTIQDKNDIRCPVCEAEYNLAALMKARSQCCPHCGYAQAPLKISEDGYLKINWQEVRILAIYSQRWASTFDTEIKGNKDAIKVLNRIVEELYKYKPITGATLDPMVESKEIKTAIKDRKDEQSGIPSPFFLLNKKY